MAGKFPDFVSRTGRKKFSIIWPNADGTYIEHGPPPGKGGGDARKADNVRLTFAPEVSPYRSQIGILRGGARLLVRRGSTTS